jgi:steroid Delta-isomerase
VTLLREHVERFNHGVRTGDWGPMLAYLANDAELVFEGVPVGPFRGRDAIEAAYREQPPDDEIELLPDGGYAWKREPGRRAGELRLESADGAIKRITVTFE